MSDDGRTGDRSGAGGMRDGIRAAVEWLARGSGRAARRAGPWGMVAFLVAGAVTPAVVPLVTAAGSAAVTAGLLGLAGNIGSEYVADVLRRSLARMRDREDPSPDDIREIIATDLSARLEGEGEDATALRAEVAAILRHARGVETAVGAAVEAGSAEVQRALSQAFTELGGAFAEFHYMLDELAQTVGDIRVTVGRTQRQVTAQGIEQRRQTDMLRRMYVALMVLTEPEPELRPEPDAALGAGPRPDEPGVRTAGENAAPPTPAAGCPYQGLAAFEAEDATRFFGREELTATVVNRLAEQARAAGVLIVTGPSGAGKSSLLHAGVLPALARGALPGSASWPWLTFTPGERPVAELVERTASLAGVAAPPEEAAKVRARRFPAMTRQVLRAAGELTGTAPDRLLVVVDQFEEVFTQCGDEAERRAFVSALCDAAGAAAALVVIGVRADFHGRCAVYPELVPLLQDAQVVVGPMSAAGLRSAIEEPARRAGLPLEPALPGVLLDDLGVSPGARPDTGTRPETDAEPEAGVYEAGALPLLSHALQATWRHRRGDTLTVEAYRAAGGIRGAVAATAEEIYAGLSDSDRQELRRLLRRLVTVGDGVEDTRRRADRAELGDPRVLARLVEARLVTVHQDTAEITHEALLRAWPRLRGWLSEDRAGLRVHRRLTADARNWADLGRDPDVLYRGVRLDAAREWAEDHDADLNDLERDYLAAGLRAREEEEHAERRRARGLRVVAATLAVLLAAALTAAGVAWWQRRTAVAAERLATSRRLLAQADVVRASDPRAALLLDLAAGRITPGPQARAGLLATLTRTRYAGALPGQANLTRLAFAPDGRTLATAEFEKNVTLWDVGPAGSPKRLAVLDHVPAESAAFAPDGRTLAVAEKGGTTLWDVADRSRPVRVATLPGTADSVNDVAFAPDGRTLAAGANDGVITLWDLADRARPAEKATFGDRGQGLRELTFGAGGRTLAVETGGQSAALWDLSAGRPRRLAALGGGNAAVTWVALSPDGRTLATADFRGTATLWDLADRSRPRRVATLTGHTATVKTVAFAPDGRTLATGADDGTAMLWDVADRAHPSRTDTLTGGPVMVSQLAFGAGGRTLVAERPRYGATLWDVAGRGTARPTATFAYGTRSDVRIMDASAAGAFAPGGNLFATGGDDGRTELWDVTSRDRPRRIAVLGAARPFSSGVLGVAFTPDGRTLATANDDGSATLWDVAGHARQATVSEPVRPGTTGNVDVGVAVSPDGRTLAIMDGDDSTTLWDVRDRARPAKLATVLTRGAAQEPFLARAGFSPDGRTLATTGHRVTMLWDVRDRARPRHVATLPAYADHVSAVTFAPGGRVLATTGDHVATLWDVRDRAHPVRLATLTGHAYGVTGAVFSPDGRLLATEGNDGAARLWDVTDPSSATLLATLPTGGGNGEGIAFASDGRTLATLTQPTAKLWDVGPLADVAAHAGTLACQVTGGGPTRADWARLAPGIGYEKACRS